MQLTRLDIHQVRNIEHASLHLAAGVNLFLGQNGSGKTSVLEAIHLLGLGRSFRSHKIRTVVRHEQPRCTLYAELQRPQSPKLALGVERSLDGEMRLRIGNQQGCSVAELARTLPLQLINPDAFRLLEGGPSERRQFLDWGVFHYQPEFLQAWQRYQRALKQRNSLLKYAKIDPLMRAPWEHELCQQAEQIHFWRQAYLTLLTPLFQRYLTALTQVDDIKIHYYCGWDAKRSLEEVLVEGLARDQEQGFTQAGPHRADLRIKLGGRLAADILSRGQQKLVVSALKLAQGQVLRAQGEQAPLYLIDDLPAELDAQHRQAFCALLQELGSQIFITSVEAAPLASCWLADTELKQFHVEQGQIRED